MTGDRLSNTDKGNREGYILRFYLKEKSLQNGKGRI